jgi:hypothetical protein
MKAKVSFDGVVLNAIPPTTPPTTQTEVQNLRIGPPTGRKRSQPATIPTKSPVPVPNSLTKASSNQQSPPQAGIGGSANTSALSEDLLQQLIVMLRKELDTRDALQAERLLKALDQKHTERLEELHGWFSSAASQLATATEALIKNGEVVTDIKLTQGQHSRHLGDLIDRMTTLNVSFDDMKGMSARLEQFHQDMAKQDDATTRLLGEIHNDLKAGFQAQEKDAAAAAERDREGLAILEANEQRIDKLRELMQMVILPDASKEEQQSKEYQLRKLELMRFSAPLGTFGPPPSLSPALECLPHSTTPHGFPSSAHGTPTGSNLQPLAALPPCILQLPPSNADDSTLFGSHTASEDSDTSDRLSTEDEATTGHGNSNEGPNMDVDSPTSPSEKSFGKRKAVEDQQEPEQSPSPLTSTPASPQVPPPKPRAIKPLPPPRPRSKRLKGKGN